MSSPLPSQTQPIMQPRRAERLTAFFTFITAVLVAITIAMGFFWATFMGNVVDAIGSDETLGSTMNAQICGDWASFVLDQNKDGLTAAQIENVWMVTTASSAPARSKPITELCGTIPDLLTAAGRS